MAFFLPKHSSAAAARLTEDPDSPTSSRSASPVKPRHSSGRHRRLASEAVDGSGSWTSPLDESMSNDPTKSISFSSDSDEDSDSDDEMERLSATSGTTHSTDGSHASLLADMMYTDGDLQTLNQLVHKLHAAELRREAEKYGQCPGSPVSLTSDGADCPSTPVDLPAELPEHPPHFSPLQSAHRLSISAVESWRGPSLEIVPTDSVNDILPLWNAQWSDDRAEWEERRKSIREMDFRRSRTATDMRQSSPRSIRRTRSDVGVPRISSLPKKNGSLSPSRKHRRGHSVIAHSSTSTHRHYKYGKPPTLPNAKNPNPMVSKSSKKIHKKHARYALTAGMMLGIRESVGGALGVEAELDILRWEGRERAWGGADDEKTSVEVQASGEEKKEQNGDGSEEDAEKSEGGASGEKVTVSQSSSTSSVPAMPLQSSQASDASAEAATDEETTLTRECERVSKYKFPSNQFYLGSNTSRPLPHKYKFKVYAPLVFARIRSLFGVEKQTFLHSICGKFNFYEFASNARSGQFFFYSHDGRYMIKTLTYTESKFLREILPHYYRHLTRYPSTFLTHFYGMYRVCMPDAGNQRLHFIIMRSVFHTEKKIDRVWDLKGSKAGRKANEGDSVGKDLDILEEGRKLRFKGKGTRGKFLDQLARDATFLARLGIMDYSLLLGLHDCEQDAASGGADQADAGAAPATPKASQSKELSAAEPVRSNTPFRRGVLERASSAGDTKVGNDGFKALEVGEESVDGEEAIDNSLRSGGSNGALSSLMAIPESPQSESTPKTPTPTPPSPAPKNAITSRDDSGMEGYGAKSEDGTLSKREIYFCGIIDILQYYNARKMGETALRKATGNSGEDISCVDPETYGKRFVKFIGNLVEE
ncbi:hypothetical protein ACHAXT_002869 [Thalassiosira profunda]